VRNYPQNSYHGPRSRPAARQRMSMITNQLKKARARWVAAHAGVAVSRAQGSSDGRGRLMTRAVAA